MSETRFETRQKLLQLEALHDIGRALNTLQPEEELLEELMLRAMSTLDAMAGFVFSIDEQMRLQYAKGSGVRIPESDWMELEPVRRSMVLKESVSSPVHPFEIEGGLLVAPLVSGEMILGAIGLLGKERRGSEAGGFNDDDRRFIESVAAIGAAALDNSRNFHKLEMVRESLEDENRALKRRMQREYRDRLMIGDSPSMQRVIDLIARVAESPVSVLIRGESGTGKEMVARLIHVNSPRSHRPFMAINCAALPESLLEAELFGIEKGVATGVEGRPGRFEVASGGTVFLDEIGDIPLTLQAKLLRVLQEREIEKLGARRRVEVDVRILAATHRNLEELVESGQFRQDLYYRLRVVEIELPPLRDRREDIPALVRYFLDKYGEREGLHGVRISQEALQKLMHHDFRGNVRELENLIEGALALTLDPLIDENDLPFASDGGAPDPSPSGLEAGAEILPLEEMERRYVKRVLDRVNGNVSEAARQLGVDRKTVYRKISGA
ncbi:MAG: sigma-54-dependent Fis family transcriptional regulator [Acidobacteria bacterium]|nr:sigma-54-dependent Fis family transcriptional regulator [Acidobacteriota bacterium]